MNKKAVDDDSLPLVWHYFHELHAARQNGVNGWLPLSFSEILAWSALNGLPLQSWEVSAIRSMDVRVIHGEANAEPEPMTAKTFAAMFKRQADG